MFNNEMHISKVTTDFNMLKLDGIDMTLTMLHYLYITNKKLSRSGNDKIYHHGNSLAMQHSGHLCYYLTCIFKQLIVILLLSC